MLKSTMLSAGAGGESLEAGLRVVEEMRVNNVRPDKETLRMLVNAVEVEKVSLTEEPSSEFAFDSGLVTSFETVDRPPIVPSLPFDQVVEEQARIDTLISQIETDLASLPARYSTVLSDLEAFPRLRHLISKHHLEQDSEYMATHADSYVSQRLELADQQIAAAEAQYGQGSREALAVARTVEEEFRRWETGGDERDDEWKGQDFARSFARQKAYSRDADRKVVDGLIRKRKAALGKVSKTLETLERQAVELPQAVETAKEYLHDLHLATILGSDTSYNPSLAATVKQAQEEYKQQRSSSSSNSPSASALSSLESETRLLSHLRQFVSTHLAPLETATATRIPESAWRILIGRFLVAFSPGSMAWADNFKWSYRLYQARLAETVDKVPSRSLALPTLQALHRTVESEPNHPEVGGVAIRVAADILSRLITYRDGSSLRPAMRNRRQAGFGPTAYDYRPMPSVEERMQPIMNVVSSLEGVFTHAKVPEGSKAETLKTLVQARQELAKDDLFLFEDGQEGEQDVWGKKLREAVEDLQSTLSKRIGRLEKEGVRVVEARDEGRMTDSEDVVAAERLKV
jgi:hypothetical protein